MLNHQIRPSKIGLYKIDLQPNEELRLSDSIYENPYMDVKWPCPKYSKFGVCEYGILCSMNLNTSMGITSFSLSIISQLKPILTLIVTGSKALIQRPRKLNQLRVWFSIKPTSRHPSSWVVMTSWWLLWIAEAKQHAMYLYYDRFIWCQRLHVALPLQHVSVELNARHIGTMLYHKQWNYSRND